MPILWIDPSGQLWGIALDDFSLEGNVAILIPITRKFIVQRVLSEASKHYAGKGLEQGADLTVGGGLG